RHTRSYGDWSSDVCSSDLGIPFEISAESPAIRPGATRNQSLTARTLGSSFRSIPSQCSTDGGPDDTHLRYSCIRSYGCNGVASEIGRASCRERVWMLVEEG